MSRKQNYLTLATNASVDAGQPYPPGENFRPRPEEGHQLMRAFLGIKEAHLREALITLVEEVARSGNRLARNSKKTL
jgi:hypothetical protein